MLCSEMFFTSIPKNRSFAESPLRRFQYPATDYRFEEVSVFAYALIMQKFFRDNLGLGNWANRAVELRIMLDNKQDGPLYRSAEDFYVSGEVLDQTPLIMLPRVLDPSLSKLTTSPSVLFHELSHHYVYYYLGLGDYPSNDLFSLHEGLADSFAALAMNSPCLGEGICNQPNKLCMSSTCLRTADNTFVNGSAEYATQTSKHIRGTLLSATVWDLHKQNISIPIIGKILIDALATMTTASNIPLFANAMMKAAENLEAKSPGLTCLVNTTLVKRGLGTKNSSCRN
jgi:hypothetical protein